MLFTFAQAVDIIHSHFPDWDSQKCPTARYYSSCSKIDQVTEKNIDNWFWAFNYSHVLSQRQTNEEVEDESEKAEGGSETADQRDELGTVNESSNPQKISLLGFALIALIPLIL